MIICANCRHQEMLGALFCSECGAQLNPEAGTITGSFDPPPSGSFTQPPPRTGPFETEEGPALTLQLLQYSGSVALEKPGEYSVGRVNDGQTVLPDIDLSKYDAYGSGVSRIHASVTVAEDSAQVRDLGSSNGTFLNGRKLTPHLPYPLQHGDVVVFGKLQLRVLRTAGGPSN